MAAVVKVPGHFAGAGLVVATRLKGVELGASDFMQGCAENPTGGWKTGIQRQIQGGPGVFAARLPRKHPAKREHCSPSPVGLRGWPSRPVSPDNNFESDSFQNGA